MSNLAFFGYLLFNDLADLKNQKFDSQYLLGY